jgi:predicted adenine nucleotide alpha hydrolase (AANH) superfamily ATPase
MKLLLHVCCAPCAIKCVESFQEEGLDITLFWYNPNIHPYTEYTARLESIRELAKMKDVPLVIHDGYGLREFIKNVASDIDARCKYCYDVRLSATADYAKEMNFDGFSTTLLISPYQKHDLIKSIATDYEKEYEINYVYRDFRPLFRQGQKQARESGFYMQKYCGCIFSEEERYGVRG